MSFLAIIKLLILAGFLIYIISVAIEMAIEKHRQKKAGVVHKDTYLGTVNATYEARVSENPNSADAYAMWGNALLDIHMERSDSVNIDDILGKYEKASQLDPSNLMIKRLYATTLSIKATEKEDELSMIKSEELYKELCEKEPEFTIYQRWAEVKTSWGVITEDKEYLIASFPLYQKSLDLVPDNNEEKAKIHRNWAIALTLLVSDFYLLEYADEAEKHLEIATNLVPRYMEETAVAIVDLLEAKARLLHTEDSYKTLDEQYQKMADFKLSEISYEVYNSWGSSYLNIATEKHKDVYERALDKFNHSKELKSDQYEVYICFARTYLMQAIDQDNESLYIASCEQYKIALDHAYGDAVEQLDIISEWMNTVYIRLDENPMTTIGSYLYDMGQVFLEINNESSSAHLMIGEGMLHKSYQDNTIAKNRKKIEKSLLKSKQLGGEADMALSALYALLPGEEEHAIEYMRIVLSDKDKEAIEEAANWVLQDVHFKHILHNPRFKALIEENISKD